VSLSKSDNNVKKGEVGEEDEEEEEEEERVEAEATKSSSQSSDISPAWYIALSFSNTGGAKSLARSET
jgi:hypothetical protein